MRALNPRKHSLQTKLHFWNELRSVIVHEDNLVNQRLTWLFTLEGFLLGTFGVVQSTVLEKQISIAATVGAEIFLLCIMLGASWICYISGKTISAAYQQVHLVNRAWEEMYPDEKWDPCDIPAWLIPSAWKVYDPDKLHPRFRRGDNLPPIRGGFKLNISITQRIPGIVLVIDLLAAFLCILIISATLFYPQMLYKPIPERTQTKLYELCLTLH